MATYRVFAGNPTNFGLYGEIPFSTLQFSDVLNRAGSISMTVPLLDSTLLPATFVTPGSTALWVERNGDIIWGGLLWTVDVDLVGQTVNMAGEGMLSYYDHRILTVNLDTGTFLPGTAGLDVTSTMWYLLRSIHENMDASAAAPAWGYPYPPRTDVANIDISPWIVSAFAGGLGWTVVGATLASEVANFGTVIQQVSSGWHTTDTLDDVAIQTLDYWISPSWDTANNRPKAVWSFANNKRGQVLVKPLGLDAGVLSLNVTYDATNMANEVSVLGNGSGDLAPSGNASLPTTGNAFMQMSFSKQLVNPISCANFATDAVRALSKPHILPQISLLGDNPSWEYGSYGVGDVFVLDVNTGFVDLNLPWRIVEKSTSVDTSGTEIVTISVADDSLF